MNWLLLLTIVLLIIGIGLLVIYPDSARLTPKQKSDRTTKRNIGWVLIIASLGMGIYLCYTNRLTFKAQMPSDDDCNKCDEHIQRLNTIKNYPGTDYSVQEYDSLRERSQACLNCSGSGSCANSNSQQCMEVREAAVKGISRLEKLKQEMNRPLTETELQLAAQTAATGGRKVLAPREREILYPQPPQMQPQQTRKGGGWLSG